MRDDKAVPDEGRKAAEDLVLKEKVAFTVGFCNSGITKAAVFADKTGYGEGGFLDVERFLAERGVKPVHVARFDLGVKSLVAELQAARAAGAEAVVGYTVGPELAVLAAARAETKWAVPLFGPWPMSFRTVWDKSQGGAEGAMVVQSIIQDLSNERRSSFIARLKRHAGKQPIGSLMAAEPDPRCPLDALRRRACGYGSHPLRGYDPSPQTRSYAPCLSASDVNESA